MELNRRLPDRRQSTGNPRNSAPARLTGTFLFLFGLVFALMGLTLLGATGFFGLPFLLVGTIFAVVGGKLAFHVTPAGGDRPSRGPEGPVSGFNPDARDHEHIRLSPVTQAKKASRPPVSPGFNPDSRSHEHIVTSPDYSVKKQMEQLETMKGAGLIDDAEYRERKRRIMERR